MDKDKQTNTQTEDRLQATVEREVDLAVNADQTGAPAAALGLMRLKANQNFLEGSVSGVGSWKRVKHLQ